MVREVREAHHPGESRERICIRFAQGPHKSFYFSGVEAHKPGPLARAADCVVTPTPWQSPLCPRYVCDRP